MTDRPRHAELDWDEQGRPFSREFDDVYFSKDCGLIETNYVFLEQNALGERFAALAAGQCLTIGETGFGTGLNFLCAWQLFERHAVEGARLNFVSVEKFPLTPTDLGRALQLWPELQPYAGTFLEQYVAVHSGFQQFVLERGRVTLTLLIGDALEQLPRVESCMDAWFLDGFAPAKNPQMWTPELFEQVARLSGPGTTLGTFTSSGVVRRALKAVGFQMRRIPGLGKKWEIMRGVFVGRPEDSPPPPAPAGKPWFERPPQATGAKEALVIGAGLAGCATAFSLAARGYRVKLIDRHGHWAQEASGNPQGVLYLKLSPHHTALSQWILSGFGFTRRLLQALPEGEAWSGCGVLQLAFDAKEAQRQAKLAEAFAADLLSPFDQQLAEAQAGISLPSGGLFFPEGGWVNPPALCAWQAAREGIEFISHHEVLRLAYHDQRWQAWDGERLVACAPVVVMANAAQVVAMEQTAHLPLKPIRGQITRLPETQASAALATVVCAEGYVAPARLGEHTLGASFDFQRQDTEPSVEEHRSNLALLQAIAPQLAQDLAPAPAEQLAGRVGMRCTSPDYLPIVGPVVDPVAFDEAYAALTKNARALPDIPCPWQPGLFVNSGHGSRGLITAPLAGELVAAWITGETLPLPRELAEACHPNRFAVRRLSRGGQRKQPD